MYSSDTSSAVKVPSHKLTWSMEPEKGELVAPPTPSSEEPPPSARHVSAVLVTFPLTLYVPESPVVSKNSCGADCVTTVAGEPSTYIPMAEPMRVPLSAGTVTTK